MIPPSPLIVLDDWGAAGDGTTDDWAVLQTAINAADAYEGTSTIRLSTGKTYLCERDLDLRNRTGITFTGGGTLKTTGSYGAFIGADDEQHPEQLIQEADANDTSVTTTETPVGLTAGDYVLIYTGSTSAVGGGLGAPDSEINRVASLSGNTVYLVKPLAKNYRQEYYEAVLGEGTTLTTHGGPAAPLALRKIEPSKDITFDGITIDHDGGQAWLAGTNVVNLQIRNVTADCVGSFNSISAWADGGTFDSNINVQTEYAYWWSVAYGARDVTLQGCTFTNPTLGYVHIHEGASNITVRNVTCTSGEEQTGTDQPIIGLRGRGYNISLDAVTVVNAPNASGGACLRIDPGITGSAVDCVFDITNGGDVEVVNNSGGSFVIS